MTYHIVKASRIYTGQPYCGPSSGNRPATAATLAEAARLVAELSQVNPVGWRIYDAATRQEVKINPEAHR